MGVQLEIIVRVPLTIPAEPRPATARPTINITEDVAVPQSRDPNSKIPKKARKDHWDLVISNVRQHAIV